MIKVIHYRWTRNGMMVLAKDEAITPQVFVGNSDYAALEQARDRLREKLEVIALDCETVSLSEIVDKSEKRTWLSIAKRIRSALGGEGVKE